MLVKRRTPILVIVLMLGLLTTACTSSRDSSNRDSSNKETTNPEPQRPPFEPQASGSTEDQGDSEQIALHTLQTQWEKLSAKIPFKTAGAAPWALDAVQFIGRGRLLVQFKDGHETHAAVLEDRDDDFKLLKAFRLQPEFSLSEWQVLVNDFGNKVYAASTYVYDASRTDFAHTSRNVFVAQAR